MSAALRFIWSRKAIWGAALTMACGGAVAQPAGYYPSTQPYTAGTQVSGYTPNTGYYPSAQGGQLHQALEAARGGDVERAKQIQAGLPDPLQRKIVEWAMIDSAGTRLDYFELERDRRDLEGWPRAHRLNAALEKSLEAASLPPQKIIALFEGKDPATAEGAMALAAAYQQTGRIADAQALIRRFWRNEVFEADAQAKMLTRFGIYLTPEDHAYRLSNLLYGSQGPATQALLGLVTPDQRALAEARMALRADRSDATQLVSQLPYTLQNDPGLAFDRARFYRKHNLDSLAVGLTRNFPHVLPNEPEVGKAVWTERRAIMNAALKSGDYQGAYLAAADSGLTSGPDFAEAEFFAGWVALTKLHNPTLADTHFAKLQNARATPITLARALYWRGRAADAKGDPIQAQVFWSDGSKYYTTFYGQLAGSRVGQPTLTLGRDPVPSSADRTAFESRELVRATRMLGDAGERELFKTFAIAAEEDSPSAADLALLVDTVRMYGDQELSMRIVRAGAMRALYLPERGYPVRLAPQGWGLPEPAFTFAITRQESGFDPNARSSVGARGMMQLMPSTASILARKIGVSYSTGELEQADYNMKLGAAYLGDLVNDFGGSYVLATAAYNAGPGRPRQWITYCGDPRQGGGDPADFIECIPFSETRNYVERVMENLQVYRARLNGGSAPLTLATDLKRGGWTPAPSQTMIANQPLPDQNEAQAAVAR